MVRVVRNDIVGTAILGIALGLLGASPRLASAALPVPSVDRPQGQGDQVVFYYDARSTFTTYLTVRNAGSSSTLDVRILFYAGSDGGNFAPPVQRDVQLAPNALKIVDVGALRQTASLAAKPGVAFAFAVDASGTPIVTRALTGSFTVANLETGSAWGAPGAARVAAIRTVEPVESDAASSEAASPGTGEAACARADTAGVSLPSLGAKIDGKPASFPAIRPPEYELAGYFDPSTLAPWMKGGNQLIFVNFADVLGATYAATHGQADWLTTVLRSDGSNVRTIYVSANGISVTDLAAIGSGSVYGSAGSVRFAAQAGGLDNVSRLIFFAEALGTYGTGYLLPVP